MREYVGCFSAAPSHVSALRKAVFRFGLSGCVRTWPVTPKHNLKKIAKGTYMRTLGASSKTQTSDVLCRGSEARRGKSHCTKHQPQTRIFLAPLFLPWSTAASQLGHTLDPPLPTKPLQYCVTISRTSNTPSPPLPLSFWHQITLCNTFFPL